MIAVSMSSRAMPRSRAPSEDPDGLPFNSVAQAGIKAVARRQVDMSREAFLQYRLDVNQIESIESRGRVGFNENIHVAAVPGCVAQSTRPRALTSDEQPLNSAKAGSLFKTPYSNFPRHEVVERRALFDASVAPWQRGFFAIKTRYAIAFLRFSSTLSRKPSVESHFCSGPTRSARSFVI